MAKLGESSGLWTWANYHQWPLFATVMGLILLFCGFLVYGFVGALIGLVSGIVLGCVAGLALGVKKSMFPVTVEIWLSYASGDFEQGPKYPGRKVTQTFIDNLSSVPVERQIIEYLVGTKLRQLPNFSLPVWFKDGVTRKLKVLMIDSSTYLPLTIEKGQLVANDVPVYYQLDGRIIKFKVLPDGKTFEKNEDGKLIEDPNGLPLAVRAEKITVFDPNVMLEDGDVKTIPRGLAAKLDNARSNYTQAVRIAHTFNSMAGFWEKWGKELIMAITVLGLLGVSYFAYDNFSKASAVYAGDMREAAVLASQNELVASQNYLQGTMVIAKALNALGYQVNYSDIILNRSIPKGVVVVEPTPVPVHIPFIG